MLRCERLLIRPAMPYPPSHWGPYTTANSSNFHNYHFMPAQYQKSIIWCFLGISSSRMKWFLESSRRKTKKGVNLYPIVSFPPKSHYTDTGLNSLHVNLRPWICHRHHPRHQPDFPTTYHSTCMHTHTLYINEQTAYYLNNVKHTCGCLDLEVVRHRAPAWVPDLTCLGEACQGEESLGDGKSRVGLTVTKHLS